MTWDALFARATDYAVTDEHVRERLAAIRADADTPNEEGRTDE